MSSPVRVLVVDDDPLVRKGLTLMLSGTPEVEVVGEAADGAEVPTVVDRTSSDVVLMDIRMPRIDGVTATRRLQQRSEPPEVLVLTTFDTDENVLAAIRAGASGFLAKDTPPEEVIEAILRVSRGDPVLSAGATRRLLDRALVADSERVQAARALETLSGRESDVAISIAEGQSNAEIATNLYMSVATVKAHVSHILTKLELTNRTQIAILVHEAREA